MEALGWQTEGKLTMLNSMQECMQIPRVTEMCLDGSMWHCAAQYRSDCVKGAVVAAHSITE